jgi:lipopolysaccharide/colanic/teichoic acid biosynthesis glycosyltransferase
MNSDIHTLKLLYIGNDPDIISFFGHFPEWAEVIHVENGFKADQILKSDLEINCIFCEHDIPGVTGLNFIRFLTENKIRSHVPFILLHFERDFLLRRKAINAGVDDYMILPIDSQSLFERLQYLIDYKAEHLRGVARIPKTTSDRSSENVTSMRELPVLQLAIKRIFDIVSSGIALILLSPLFLLIAAAIRMESKGKVFYASKRVGQKTFDFYKFRSMFTGADARLKELQHLNQYAAETGQAGIDFEKACPRCAERPDGSTCSELLIFSDGRKMCEFNFHKQKKIIAGPTFFKLKNDPRITKVGAFIRRTSIDELPQLVNVLKGDMSIVGNRPLPVNEAQALTSDEAAKRFLAPAGITGLWQVELRGKKGQMSEEERRKLDNDYFDNFSLWFDAKIILRTIPALFQEENA